MSARKIIGNVLKLMKIVWVLTKIIKFAKNQIKAYIYPDNLGIYEEKVGKKMK